MRNDVLTLVKKTYVKDDYGVQREQTTERRVFCDVESITQKEFFAAENAGIRAAFRFDVFAYDYDGETEVIYNGGRYSIYRTYQKFNDILELYAERKTADNGTD